MQQKQNSSHGKGELVLPRERVRATFMTSKLSFRLSKEQDTASEKLTHCYALDERETGGEHVYTTTATKL